jgi:hypothetical protein
MKLSQWLQYQVTAYGEIRLTKTFVKILIAEVKQLEAGNGSGTGEATMEVRAQGRESKAPDRPTIETKLPGPGMPGPGSGTGTPL